MTPPAGDGSTLPLPPPACCVLPASFAQQRLWFLDQYEGGAEAVYHIRIPVRLEGPLDRAALQSALDQVVARHETLRTTFRNQAGEPVQVVWDTGSVPLVDVDLEGRTPDELREQVARLASAPFDLARGPLLRAVLIRVAPAEHVLLLVIHHIIADAWSSGILCRDLAAAYGSLTVGTEAGRTQPFREHPLPIQYADYAVWQREWLAGDALEAQLRWWREHLAGAPPVLALPTDRPRPALQTFRGSRLSRVLGAGELQRLKAAAGGAGVTLFMFLFAAYAVLLGRRCSQDDLVIGTPIAGRRRRELEDLVGLFANTLALRVQLPGDATFRDLLAQVRATALGAFSHQDLPFEKLVEDLRPPRDLAHPPLFQVLFALQNTPWEAGDWGRLRASPAEMAPAGTAKFDLSLSAVEYAGELWLNFEFNTDLFDEATVQAWAAGYTALLAAAATDPGQPLATLPVMSPAERAQVLTTGTGPVAPPPPFRHLWAALASRPAGADAPALEWSGGRCTAGELVARAEALAGTLVAAGAGPGTTVAVALERGPALVVALLAVLRTGARYLPLDPRHPPDRLAFILEDGDAGVLLAGPGVAARLPAFAGTVLPLAWEELAVAPATPAEIPPVPNILPDWDAYLIYTSGSTGRPKGVRISHGAVLNFLASMARTPGLGPADRLLAITTVSFDIAVLEIFLPLYTGAVIVLADADTAADPLALARWLRARAVTVLQATPATWRGLLASGWEGEPGLRAFCGGEGLAPDLALDLLPRCRELWNLYGPTETTVWSCAERVVDPVERPLPATWPVGRPIANTRCYVLDARGEPVPVGSEGELWIGGAGVAAGYHRRPALTAERFRPDPFHPDPFHHDPDSGPDRAARIYGTGDRARWRRDGRLEIRGRLDFQLKLRGFRIEPGEIETRLRALPGVADAVVVLAPGPGQQPGDERLVAWVEAAAGASLAGPELRAALARELPDYLVPAAIGLVPVLPRTPNGKLDRRALPRMAWHDANGSDPGSDPAPIRGPRTPGEEALASLFAEVLSLPAVDIHADFFALGGHSLLATRLVARIREALGVEVPLRAVFQAPSVAGLAPVVESAPDRAPVLPPAAAVAGAGSASREFPLSLVQQRLWFLDCLQPGNSVYHLAWAVALEGDLDEAALAEAVAAVVLRHESLRTRFASRDGAAWQVVEPALAPRLETGTVAAAELPRRLEALVQRPFDLDQGPLVRFALLREEGRPDRARFAVVIHHIIADGWSLAVLFRDLGAAYRAARLPEAPRQEPLPLQYGDWAVAQRAELAGGELQRQRDYWCRKLRGAPLALDLYGAGPRPLLSAHRGARRSLLVPPAGHGALRDLARRTGCTLYTVLLAAFGLLLARYAGREEVLVGAPVAGRRHSTLDNLVGFFVNTLVMRVDVGGNPDFGTLLRRVKAMTLEAWEHQDLPFEQLVEALAPPRDPARTPVFQVMFNFHTEPAGRLDLPGVTVTPVAVGRDTAKFDLTVSLAETAAGLAVTLEYSTELFDGAWAERFGDHYARLLAAVAEEGSSTRPVATLGLAPPALPPSLGVAARAALRDRCTTSVGAAFRVRAQAQPDAPALVTPAGIVTYGELARWAGDLAGVLRDRGVGPGDRVGLWFGQGPGQVAAMLGVLEAGAAFVPLDPALPPERRARISAAAGLREVLGDGSAGADAPAPGVGFLDIGARPESGHRKPGISVPPEAPAYLLHTSGTTGLPRPVVQTHRNLLHHVLAWGDNLGLGPGDRLALCASYGADSALQDIFGALLAGAALVPVDLRTLGRSEVLQQIAAGVTVLHLTPTVFRYLFGDGTEGQAFPRLGLVVLGGEAARDSDLALARRHLPAARFVNGYGLTEATAVLQWLAPAVGAPPAGMLPMGNPVGDAEVELEDDDGGSAAVAGELVVRSPWVTPAAAPVLRTGDLARRLPDGSLLWTGRRDFQVKVGGNRVETAEVEAVLARCPGVARGVVLGVPDGEGGARLVAWVEGTEEGTGDGSAIRAFLRSQLPPWAVPVQIRFRSRWPTLPNGKVDRQALLQEPAPVETPASSSPAGAGSGQDLLAQLWQELLPGSRPGPRSDFFAAGGHSLLAMRFIARIRERLGVDLPLLQFFGDPTLGGLAAAVAALEKAPPGPSPGAIRPRAPGPRGSLAD